MISTVSTPLLHYWVAGRPMPGERESSDQFLVKHCPQGALVAVVDGLGHGKDACAAAKLAVVTRSERTEEQLLFLIQRCH